MTIVTYLSTLFDVEIGTTSHRSLGWTALSLGLVLLPEIVDVWNRIREYQWNNKASSAVGPTTKIQLDVPGMACVACISK